MVGYYRKFIRNFATIALPLTDCTKKGKPNHIQWDKEAEEAFLQLMDQLSRYPVLQLPKLDKPFVLTTDASQGGIGAVLQQEHDGMQMPVTYVSRKLKPAETRYSTIERECLALVWATKRLHHYLYGREFVFETDHQPLLCINKPNIQNDRVMRWALSMQMYRYSARPGLHQRRRRMRQRLNHFYVEPPECFHCDFVSVEVGVGRN